MSTSVPSWHIDASNRQRGEGFDIWAEYARPLYDARAPWGADNFTATATGYLLDQLIFVRSCFEPLELGRSRRHLASEPSEFLTINIFKTGGFTGLIEDTPITKRPHEVVLQDASRALRAVVDRSDVLAVIVPFRVLGFDPSRHRPYLSLAADSSKGRVLASVTQDIFDRLPSIDREEAPAIASGYAGMLRGIFLESKAEADQRSLRRAVRSAMLSFIDGQLNNPRLDADLLCKVFGLSRASLYRLFQCQGGVDQTIRRRRLYRCFRELTQRGPHTTVRSVAERYGFHNPSHFTRSFKALFFVSPSEIGELVGAAPRSAGAPDPQGSNELVTLHEWLYQTCGLKQATPRMSPVPAAAE